MEVKKIVEEWKIWNEKEKVAKSEEEAKKLVSQRFYKWIYVFGKKQSKRIPMKKIWNYAVETKKGFVSRKRKVYLLSREKGEEIHKFIKEQLRKEYIRPAKLSQIALVFFVEKKDGKKHMV